MLTELLIRYRSSGVFLDTNLLVLYLVGSYDADFVSKFKRTSMYTKQDFLWLKEYSEKFSKIVVTPQVLAETWNLIEKINEKKFKEFVNSIMNTLYLMNEHYVEKDDILENDGFNYIGITDISVILAAKRMGCLVLTDDLRAYSYFVANEVESININHLRQL